MLHPPLWDVPALAIFIFKFLNTYLCLKVLHLEKKYKFCLPPPCPLKQNGNKLDFKLKTAVKSLHIF